MKEKIIDIINKIIDVVSLIVEKGIIYVTIGWSVSLLALIILCILNIVISCYVDDLPIDHRFWADIYETYYAPICEFFLNWKENLFYAIYYSLVALDNILYFFYWLARGLLIIFLLSARYGNEDINFYATIFYF